MKKFLSMVLALVMTMSLVTISAGAKDFTDGGKITYKEAVDVISDLGIVDGYTDGAFNPQNNLTRGAAAKIICNLILGPTTADSLNADTAPFVDVPIENDFAGYIAYCVKEGIISGYADGTFRPGNTLSGFAFMKMLLGALGYDAAIQGFTGPNWTVNVAKLALGIELNAGLSEEFDGNDPVNREEACLFAFNTLQATMVEYGSKTTVEVNGATVNVGGQDYTEVKEDGYKSYDGGDDDTLQFCEKYFKDLKKDASTDDFGRPANIWTLKNDEIGTYAKTPDASFTKKVTKADIYTAVGKSVVNSLEDGKATLHNYIDGEGGKIAKGDVDDFMAKNDSGKVNESGNGMLTEVFVDDDNNTTIVSINTWVFQAVSDYNSSKESVDISAAGDTEITLTDRTLELDDFDIEDVASDDYLLVTATKDGNKYNVQTVAPAEVVTGPVSGYKVQDAVTIDGTEYKYALTTEKTGVQDTQYTVGQDAAVVLDAYGYIIAVDSAVVSSNYVFVSEFAQPSGLSSGKIVGAAFFTDGTTKDITVKELLGSSNKSTIKSGDAGWYTYSVNSADEYSLYAAEKKYETGTSGVYNQVATYTYANKVVTKNDTVSFMQDTTTGAKLKANDSTIVVVKDNNDDVSVFTGVKNIPDITLNAAGATATITSLAKSNDYAYYVFIDLDGDSSVSGGADTKLVYFLKYDGQHRGTDNEIYYTYKTLENGDEVVVEADSKVAGTGDIYGVYYKGRTNADERLTSIEKLDGLDGKYFYGSGTDTTITYSDGALSLNGYGKEFTMADDYNIVLVTTKGANVLNKDQDASYEVSDGITAKTLGDTLKNYKVTYTAAGKTTDSEGSVIEELYVTITGATYTGSTPDPNVPADPDGTESYVSGGTVYAKLVDTTAGAGTVGAEVKNTLKDAGYTNINTTNVNAGGGTVSAKDTEGDTVVFDVDVTNFWTVKVDGVIKEYVKDSEDATTQQKAIKGSGTGYLLNDEYVAYDDVATTVAATVTEPQVISTGYATLGSTSVNAAEGTATVSGYKNDGAVDYFDVSKGLTVEYTGAGAAAGATVGKDVTLSITGGSGATIDKATQSLTLKQVQDGGAKLTFKVNTSNITADVTSLAISVANTPAIFNVTTQDPAVAKGLTITLSADKSEVKEGGSVKVTVSISGTATAATAGKNIEVTAPANWSSSSVPANAAVAATVLSITDGTVYDTPVTATFTVTASAANDVEDITVSIGEQA